jgi:ribose transport system permease protein
MSNKTPSSSSTSDEMSNGKFGEWGRQILSLQAFQIFLVLMAICLLFFMLAPHAFLAWGNIRQILQNMSILVVLGIGMTFVIVTSGIDLSVGSVLVFSGVIAALVMRTVGGDNWGVALLGVLCAIASGLAWGVINGVLIAKAQIPPFIVTLGSYGAALGLALVTTHGVDIQLRPTVLTRAVGYGNISGTTIPILVLIAFILLIILGTIFHKTRFGLYVAAVGSNEEAARRVGVNVDRVLISVYMLSGGLAGLAGILSLAQFSTTAINGQAQTNLNVISAVVIGGTSLFGGTGTMAGTVIGLCIPAVLQNGFVIIGVQPFWQQVAVGIVLMAAVWIDQRRRQAAARGYRPRKSFSRRSGKGAGPFLNQSNKTPAATTSITKGETP